MDGDNWGLQQSNGGRSTQEQAWEYLVQLER